MSARLGRPAKRAIGTCGVGLVATFLAAACGTAPAEVGQSSVGPADGPGTPPSSATSGQPGGGAVGDPTPRADADRLSDTAGRGAGIPRCRADQLSADVGGTRPAAGNRYAPLIFTNDSGRTCGLLGYPGVTVLNGDREQIGPDADRAPGNPVQLVTLPPGGSASSLLHWASPAAGDCHATSSYLRGFPPGSTEAIVVPAEIRLCGKVFDVRSVTEGIDGIAGGGPVG